MAVVELKLHHSKLLYMRVSAETHRLRAWQQKAYRVISQFLFQSTSHGHRLLQVRLLGPSMILVVPDKGTNYNPANVRERLLRIISRKILREFWENPLYRDSTEALKAWYAITRRADWGTHRQYDKVVVETI